MSRRRTLLFGWMLALPVAALFAALGSWQLGRMQQKQAMLDAAAEVLAGRDARPLAAAADATRVAAYDWAAGEGEFAPGPAVLLDNQQRSGRPGVRVYRLFRPREGAPLLVELGWLPMPPDRTVPAPAPIAGLQQVSGLLVAPPSPGLAKAAPAETAHGDLLAIRLDSPGLAQRLGTDRLPPRLLRLDPSLPLGHVRDLDVLPNTLPPEKHLGYAVQWFGLASAVLAIALVLTFRRSRT